jgi:hypothetical protein
VVANRPPRALLSYPLGIAKRERLMEQLVKPLTKESGFDVISPHGQLRPGERVWQNAPFAIRASNVVIAEVTDASPRVVHELGLAHAWGKWSMLLTERPESVPVSVAQTYPMIVYSSAVEAREEFAYDLRQALERLHARSGLITPTDIRALPLNEHLVIELLGPRAHHVDGLRVVIAVGDAALEVGFAEQLALDQMRVGTAVIWIPLGGRALNIIRGLKKRFSETELRAAQAERARAEAELARARAEAVRHETARQDQDAVLTLVERVAEIAREYPEVPPIRLTLGGELRVDVAAGGLVTLDQVSPAELAAAPAGQEDDVEPPDVKT